MIVKHNNKKKNERAEMGEKTQLQMHSALILDCIILNEILKCKFIEMRNSGSLSLQASRSLVGIYHIKRGKEQS